MDAPAERHMFIIVAANVESLRIWEAWGIAISGGYRRELRRLLTIA
jgi:hypothetical protein